MAKKEVYELQFSYEAPDLIKTEQVGKVVSTFFEEGEMVIGEPYHRTSILVEDRYVIPMDYVKKTDKFPYLKKNSKFDDTIGRIKEQAVQISEKENEKLDKVGTNVKDVVEGRTKMKLQGEAKSYRNGALLGLGSGVLLALYLRKNIWVFGLLGVAVGGYVAHKIHKSKEGNNKVEPVTV
jgi:hypothetical protein